MPINEPFICNLCQGRQFIHLFDERLFLQRTFPVVRCATCGLVCTWPLPDEEFLEKLYNHESYKKETVSGLYCLSREVNGADSPCVLERLRYLSPGNHLLDIGCGVGGFVRQALKKGWDAKGVEPSPYACQIAKAGLEDRIQQIYLEEADFPEASFDAVTLWYVLEHVVDPSNLLLKCFNLLKPEGAIFVAVPNANYILMRRQFVRITTGEPGTIHAHEHLYNFTSETLRGLLSKTGFEFVSEHVASPYLISSNVVNTAKRAGRILCGIFFRMTGINMGGIMMFSRKPHAYRQESEEEEQ